MKKVLISLSVLFTLSILFFAIPTTVFAQHPPPVDEKDVVETTQSAPNGSTHAVDTLGRDVWKAPGEGAGDPWKTTVPDEGGENGPYSEGNYTGDAPYPSPTPGACTVSWDAASFPSTITAGLPFSGVTLTGTSTSFGWNFVAFKEDAGPWNGTDLVLLSAGPPPRWRLNNIPADTPGTHSLFFSINQWGGSPFAVCAPAASFTSVAPPAPTISEPACINPGDSGAGISISWTNSNVSWVDIDNSQSFAEPYYHRDASITGSPINGTGFGKFCTGGCIGTLTFNPNTVYYVRTFNGGAHSDPASFSIPPCFAPPPPGGLTASCPLPGTTASLNWDDAAGATYYQLRVNNETNEPTFSCTSPPGDFCIDNKTVSDHSFSSTPGANYTWWVHACNISGCSAGTPGPPFTCTLPPPPVSPWIQTTGGDVHSNERIITPGGPP